MAVDRNSCKLRFDLPLSITATKFLSDINGNTETEELIISHVSPYTLKVINSAYWSLWPEENFPAA